MYCAAFSSVLVASSASFCWQAEVQKSADTRSATASARSVCILEATQHFALEQGRFTERTIHLSCVALRRLSVAQAAQKKAEWHPGVYVRVFGHARCGNDSVLRVTGFNVRTITDFNEVRHTQDGVAIK
jgi:hypothetical protein